MGRFTLYDFQYVHLKLRHYRCYHDVERKAIEICEPRSPARLRQTTIYAERGELNGIFTHSMYYSSLRMPATMRPVIRIVYEPQKTVPYTLPFLTFRSR